jgi:uncharacterized protein (DUF1015 family)
MSIVKPFQALRPRSEFAERVSCVPYDVVDLAEARAVAQSNAVSFLHVTRPEVDVEQPESTSHRDIMTVAERNLQKFIADGALIRETEDALYVYRQNFNGHTQTGVVGCCAVDEYDSGLIKKHENTRPDKVEDRTEHMLKIRAHTGLIFLAYRGSDSIDKLVNETLQSPPLYDFKCPAGVQNTIWKAVDPAALEAAFAEVSALYIADGHHRAESASHTRAALKNQNPNHTGNEAYNFFIAAMFPAEQLRILPYNRAVKDLNGLSEADFLASVGENFVVSEASDPQPKERGEICMYLGGKWHHLRFSVNFFADPGLIASLDASILQDYILAPALGITDARTDTRISFVGGALGTKELERLVDSGEAAVAFSMFPTSMTDLLAVSDLGEVMPPKTTWFEPKLRDGLLIHLI